jgi:hypothetical protein
MQYIGQDKAVTAKASNGVALHVYPACDQTAPTCDIRGAFYGASSVAWTAAAGVEYLLLVTSTESSSSSSTREFFELKIVDNDACENAFGPIHPTGVDILLRGSTSDGATVDTEVVSSCGFPTKVSAPGVWYTIIGDGGVITASTCTGTDFDSQISIFTGGSCGQLTCVNGPDIGFVVGCFQTGVDFQSMQDQTYHVLVHGIGDASGNFALRISTEFCGSQLLIPDGVARNVILADAAATDNLDFALDLPTCSSTLSEKLPSYGLWYRIIGTGNIMSVQQESASLFDLSGTRISVLSGAVCSQLSCVVTDCIDTCDWESQADKIYFIFVTFIDLIGTTFTDFLTLLREARLSLTAGERIVDNDSCADAFGPISPGLHNSLSLFGSTSAGATVDAVPSCGLASRATAPGVWYTIVGNGRTITASTCTGTDYDSQISVFTGSCGKLTCVDGNDDECGSQSRLDFRSIQDETYHVLVHGFGGASGNFTLFIPARLEILLAQPSQDFSSPQYEAFDWITTKDSTDLQSTLSDDALVERFVLVLLYFSTNGESWTDQAGFLNPLNAHCSWISDVLFSPTFLDCNDEGSVVTLDQGKFSQSSTCYLMNCTNNICLTLFSTANG